MRNLVEAVLLFPDWDKVSRPKEVKDVYILPWSLSAYGVTSPKYIEFLGFVRDAKSEEIVELLSEGQDLTKVTGGMLIELIYHGDFRKAADVARRLRWENPNLRRELTQLEGIRPFIGILFEKNLDNLPSKESEFPEYIKSRMTKVM